MSLPRMARVLPPGRRLVSTRSDRVSVPDAGYLVVQQVDDVTNRDCAEGSEGSFGWCGALDLYAYTNLTAGTPAFAATSPILAFFANGTVRYVAILTQQPLPPVADTQWSPRTAAVVRRPRR